MTRLVSQLKLVSLSFKLGAVETDTIYSMFGRFCTSHHIIVTSHCVALLPYLFICIMTDTIDDIVSYARSWTGFITPSERGGVSVSERQSNDKVIDPMRIDQATRDKFPKTNLLGGYIGDHVPLCEDLPPKHHLRKGATYRALGAAAKPEWQDDMVSSRRRSRWFVYWSFDSYLSSLSY